MSIVSCSSTVLSMMMATARKKDRRLSASTISLFFCVIVALFVGFEAKDLLVAHNDNTLPSSNRALTEVNSQLLLSQINSIVKTRDKELANVLLRVKKDDDGERKTVRGKKSSTPSFHRAYEESFGFFDDISDGDWERKRQISEKQLHHGEPHVMERKMGLRIPKHYYMNNWHPEFTCPFEQALGNVGDGHKWVSWKWLLILQTSSAYQSAIST